MKCFTIKEGKVTAGISVDVPHDPAVVFKDGVVREAGFILETFMDDDEGFTHMLKTDLSSASELAAFELTPSSKRAKRTHILVAVDPSEVRRAEELGDTSDVVHRGRSMLVFRCPVQACVLADVKIHGRFYSVVRGVLKVMPGKGGRVSKLKRSLVEERRKKETMVYEYK